MVPAAALPSWPEPANLTAPGRPSANVTQAITTTPSANVTQPITTALSANVTQPIKLPPAVQRAVGPDQQGGRGTVYGGPDSPGPADMTIVMPIRNPVENTGSLTGHILAQGWTDTPTSNAGTAKMIGVLVAGLAVLVAIGLLVVFAAGDTFSTLFGGMLGS